MYNKNSLTTLLFVMSFMIILIVGSQFLSPLLIAFILIAGMYGIILVGRPAELLFLSMLLVLFNGTISSMNLPFFKFYDNVFLAIFFALLVGWSLTGKYSKEVIPKESRKIFGPVLACIFISAVMGGGGLSAFAQIPYYGSAYVSYIMFFLVGRQVLSDKHIPKIIHFFVGYMVFQYILNRCYVAGLDPLPHPFVRLVEDRAVGTLSGSLQSAYFALLACFLIFSLLDNRAINTIKRKILWGLFAVFMVHDFFLTNASHAVLLFAVCVVVYMGFIARRKIFKVVAVLAIVGVIPLYLGFQSMSFESSESGTGVWQKNLSVKSIDDRWNYSTKHGPKMEVYRKAFVEGLSNPRTYLFGVGAGRGISSRAMRIENPVAMYYLGDIFLTTTGSMSLKGGSILETPVSGLNDLMVELGIVGICCYYFPYFYLLFRISGFYRRGQYNRNQAILAGALIQFIILTLIVSLLARVFSVAFYYTTIWVLAGLVWDPAKPKPEVLEAQEEMD